MCIQIAMETELRPQIVMARYSRRSENEQLLRLERPSSSSTQSSSHVIDSCFNEILSQPTLDAKEIYNLALSRRGSSDYHEGFITELKRVCGIVLHIVSIILCLCCRSVMSMSKS